MQPNEMEAAEAGPLSTAQALPACDICDKVFKSVTDVKKHQIVHFPGKYVCSTCGKKFKTPGNRNVHERKQESQHDVQGYGGGKEKEETKVNG